MAKGKPARLFAVDLKKFGEVTRDRARAIFIKIALELDERVVMDTPVLTGSRITSYNVCYTKLLR